METTQFTDDELEAMELVWQMVQEETDMLLGLEVRNVQR